jgi:hypothetical protein
VCDSADGVEGSPGYCAGLGPHDSFGPSKLLGAVGVGPDIRLVVGGSRGGPRSWAFSYFGITSESDLPGRAQNRLPRKFAGNEARLAGTSRRPSHYRSSSSLPRRELLSPPAAAAARPTPNPSSSCPLAHRRPSAPINAHR